MTSQRTEDLLLAQIHGDLLGDARRYARQEVLPDSWVSGYSEGVEHAVQTLIGRGLVRIVERLPDGHRFADIEKRAVLATGAVPWQHDRDTLWLIAHIRELAFAVSGGVDRDVIADVVLELRGKSPNEIADGIVSKLRAALDPQETP